MGIRRMAAAIALAAVGLMEASAWAEADSLGKTPTYWYTFDGAIVSRGSSALKCAFDDSGYAFLPCRGEGKGWRVNCNRSYHGENVFAPGNGSFTVFLSVSPGAGQSNRYIFSLGSNTSTTNLAFVLMFGSRIGVARWDYTHCGSNLRAYGLMAADGVPGRVHPYALVYDGTAHRLTLYSGGVACAEAPFEGFGGVAGDPTPFQFGSVYGGQVRPFSTVPVSGSVAEGLPLIEDFRFYGEALTAEEVAQISAELPSTWTAEEAAVVGELANNGELPRYWYTFDGAVRSRGASDLVNRYDVDYPEHSVPSFSSYEQCRDGGKAGVIPGSSRPGGNWFVHRGGSFTLFLSSTSGTVDGGVLLCIGAFGTTKNLTLVRESATNTKIVWRNGTTYCQTLVSAAVDSPADYVHPYVVRYSADRGKIEFFVDGDKAGEATSSGLDATAPTAFQFGGVYGGSPTDWNLKTYDNVRLEALKFYERALTDEEVVGLSAEYESGSGRNPVQEIGRYPEYWYTFSQSAPVKRAATLPLGPNNNGSLQCSAPTFARRGGHSATNLTALSGSATSGAYGSALDMSGAFTIFASARMKKSSKRGILFSLGGLGDSTDAAPAVNLAVTSTPEGEMALSRWTWNSNATGRRTDLVATTGLNAVSDFHPYAVVWDGAKLVFYVDGVKAGESTNFGDVTSGKYQIGSIHGGIGGSLGLEVGKYAIEDLRIYKTALTAEQVARISARYAQWPNGALVWNGGAAGPWDYTTANWLAWDAANWTPAARTFASGDSALFDVAVTGLDVAGGIVADEVKFGASCFWTTVNRVRCSSLSIAGGALVVPANVLGAIVPGARLFYGYASALFPVDHVDSYGNAYYENESHTSLSFGRQGGLVIIAR